MGPPEESADSSADSSAEVPASAAPRAPHLAGVGEIDSFAELIDVRSPSEFALDHIPGAINLPVLDDGERALVGTVHAKDSPFAARRLGSAMVARNIARHLEESLRDRPRTWRPLVYCWRGGQRSGAFTFVLTQVGWPARRLEGGYKAWRRRVLEDLDSLPTRLRLQVVHGPTGSGKTAFLAAAAAQGAQVLDLEGLARHRGSVLGAHDLLEEGEPQPSQRAFETAIHAALRRFDPARPVFVEAESRRIGRLGIPGALFAAMRSSPGIALEVPIEERVRYLVQDYGALFPRTEALRTQLERLVPLHGARQVALWCELASASAWDELARDLVQRHYDPAYRRGAGAGAGSADVVQLARLDEESLARAAAEAMVRLGAR